MSTLRESLEMVRDDAESDAKKRVEFTPLGLGSALGEELAMTQALAKACLTLLERVESLERTRLVSSVSTSEETT